MYYDYDDYDGNLPTSYRRRGWGLEDGDDPICDTCGDTGEIAGDDCEDCDAAAPQSDDSTGCAVGCIVVNGNHYHRAEVARGRCEDAPCCGHYDCGATDDYVGILF